MIQFRVFLMIEYPCKHRPGIDRAAGNRGVYGVVDQSRSAAAGFKTTEGEVVIPWDHGKLSVLFVQIVIMDHGASVTVEIEYKVMDHKIADDFINIYRSFERFVLTFIQIFQRFDQSNLVSIGRVGLGIVEDIGITVKLVISINKGYITATHAFREAPAS